MSQIHCDNEPKHRESPTTLILYLDKAELLNGPFSFLCQIDAELRR